MKVVLEGGSAEYIEKKSRFIATVRAVNSVEEAAAFIAEMKKQYWDARHNCSAFTIGENNEITRCTDDGEPQGTAGRPMLAVLTGTDVHNVCVVVTRYFGGVLLGTGGLVRAYSKSVQDGLDACLLGEVIEGVRLRIGCDYGDGTRVQRCLQSAGLKITDSSYTDKMELETFVRSEFSEKLKKDLTDQTAGRARFLIEEKVTTAVPIA